MNVARDRADRWWLRSPAVVRLCVDALQQSASTRCEEASRAGQGR